MHQVLPAPHAFRRGFEFARSQRALLRANHRPPSHREVYGSGDEYQQNEKPVPENSCQDSSPGSSHVPLPWFAITQTWNDTYIPYYRKDCYEKEKGAPNRPERPEELKIVD